MARIALIAALDTKGAEAAFIAAELERRGDRPLVIDIGGRAAAGDAPAVWLSRGDVARAAGATLAQVDAADRGTAVGLMAAGCSALLAERHAAGEFDAVIAIGGGAGTSIAARAMRALPIGVPKVMVSTLAGGDVSGFVGESDIVMVPAVVDISGINRISRGVFARAAAAVSAMAAAGQARDVADRPTIAASMFGNTTKCVEAARTRLEAAGYEVLVFHATGTGGRMMEGLVRAGLIDGVFDATTTELADQLVGGVMAADDGRLRGAARRGVAAVVAPGCLDMVNFWAPETVPAKFMGRRFYQHAPNVTLMRTTPEECAELGRRLAERVNESTGPVAVFLPLRGVSVISAPGGPFHWPEADEALFGAIRQTLRSDIECHVLDHAINDPEFAAAMADRLLEMLAAHPTDSGGRTSR